MNEELAAVYSSPRVRALETARRLGREIALREALCEIDRVVARLQATFLVQVTRADAAPLRQPGKASGWLSGAVGSVRLGADETVDQARMDHL